jgi:hypothetical protein
MNAEAIKRGHTYVTESGFIRRIDTLSGKTVGWRDPAGTAGGTCEVGLFAARAVREATNAEVRAAERQRH